MVARHFLGRGVVSRVLALALALPASAGGDDGNDDENPWEFALGVGFERFKTDYVDEVAILGEGKTLAVKSTTSWRNGLWAVGIMDTRAESDAMPNLFVAAKVVGEDGTASLKDAAIGFSWSVGKSALGFGIGIANHRSRSLAPGLRDQRPLPDGYGSNDVYRERSEWGLILLTSYKVRGFFVSDSDGQ